MDNDPLDASMFVPGDDFIEFLGEIGRQIGKEITRDYPASVQESLPRILGSDHQPVNVDTQ